MISTWISSDDTSRLAGAPIARSSVSAPAFWNVTMRKNSPVTHGTTRPYSRKMMANDCSTWETPGVLAAASSRVSASSSSDWALMLSTTSASLTPSSGCTAITFGSGVPASGFTDCTAATYVSYDVNSVGATLSCTSSAIPTTVTSNPPGRSVIVAPMS